MIKDIPQLKVEDIAIAMVPTSLADPMNNLWDVYLLNLKEESLSNVLIVAKGYAEDEVGPINSSTLRYFFENIPGKTMALIEPIQPELFSINNEYWISFSLNDYMFDKRYVFVQGAIQLEHLITLPIGNQIGVMIK